MKTIESIIRAYFGLTSALFPELAGKQAFNLFVKTQPQTKRFRKREKSFYHKNPGFQISGAPEDSWIYEIGDPAGELVILIHGWHSNAGSLARIGQRLAETGKRVVSFDLPGHGRSGLKTSNLFECREALRNLIYTLDPKEPFSIVSHSWGSAVAANALHRSTYKVKNWIMLSTLNDLSESVKAFGKQIGLGTKAYRVVERFTDEILKERMSSLVMEEWLKEIDFGNLLIIHDRFDKVIPYSNSVEIQKAHPRVILQTLEKVGHYRMLNDPGVIELIEADLQRDLDLEKIGLKNEEKAGTAA